MKSTFRQLQAIIPLLCLFLFLPTLLNAQSAPSDSAQYWNIRNRLPADDSNTSLLQTADALAKEGLYREALEICEALAPLPTEAIATIPSSKAKKKSNVWRVSLGSDYYHLEDYDDTTMMTPAEYKDYLRLTESPLSIWGRAAYEINCNHPIVHQLSPRLYISNYRSSFELPATFRFFSDHFSIEPAVKAGKWFQEDASDSIVFKPFQRYSSDMGGASFRLAPIAAPKNERWSWRAPFTVDWEHFDKDRSGYESLIEYQFSPAIEYRKTGTTSFAVRCMGEAHYENYYRPESDSLDVLRGMINGESTIRTNHHNLQVKGEWLHDRYFNAFDIYSPYNINRWKATLRYGNKRYDRVQPQLIVQPLVQKEIYRKPDYVLAGSELSVRPTVRVYLFDKLYVEPEGIWEKRWADLNNDYNNYIWWALSSWEGSFRGVLTLSFIELITVDLLFTAAYRWEHIDPLFFDVITDNRNFKLLFDGNVSITRHFSINTMCDYQYRIYTPFIEISRRSHNITGSLTMSFTW
jgi:hypothetical protein